MLKKHPPCKKKRIRTHPHEPIEALTSYLRWSDRGYRA